MARQRRARITIERRADGIGDVRQFHVLGAHDAVFVFEMIHR